MLRRSARAAPARADDATPALGPAIAAQRAVAVLTSSAQTLFALVCFVSAMALESAVWLRFRRRLQRRHPKQWAHAAQPPQWQDRTLFSARHRTAMLAVYWITAVAGVALLVSVATTGW